MNILNDVLQNRVTEGTPVISPGSIALSLMFALLLSVLMYGTFERCHSKIAYDKKFNVTLVMLAIVSTLIMTVIKNNVALSLGMMGSLSIVRFRTNTKDPRDLGFVFWAMAIGVTASTLAFSIGIVFSAVIGALLIFSGDNNDSSTNLLLVIRGSRANIPLLSDIIMEHNSSSRLKAQNLVEDSFELVYEIKGTKKGIDEQDLASEIKAVPGVDTVNLLTPSSEII